MSKGLEALERIRKYCIVGNPFGDGIIDRSKSLRIIESELKALEIIKEKNVHVPKLRNSSNLEEYNKCFRDKRLLIQEEFVLLKEVLL